MVRLEGHTLRGKMKVPSLMGIITSPEPSVIYSLADTISQKKLENPQVCGIIEIGTDFQYSIYKGLSSERYCPKKTRGTNKRRGPDTLQTEGPMVHIELIC
jgi:hypothetical protein